MTHVILSLLRHAKVPSHEGDMSLTADAHADIVTAAARLRAIGREGDRFLFLATHTHRSRQTAEALRSAIASDAPEVEPSWGLRNPDLYLAGARVEMMSNAEAIAGQLSNPKLAPEEVFAHPFFHGFLTADDRIGFWLTYEDPPGETAALVGKRVLQFARSFAAGSTTPRLVVACVTHSPVLRALIVEGLGLPDPGEPRWVEAVNLEVNASTIRYEFRGQSGML